MVLGKLFYPIIVINLLFSFKEQRANKSIRETIDSIRREGEEMDRFITEEYRLTVQQAITWLADANAGLIGFINKIASAIPNRKE
jgi:hypothetical protein